MRRVKTRIVAAVLMTVFLSTDPAQGQKVEVDLNDVPDSYRSTVIDAVNKSKKKQQSTPDTVSQWVGVGKEVGMAMNAGLGAVVENAEKFGKSEVGKYTMWLIMWRLFGRDILHVGLGALWLATGLSIVLWSYKRTLLPRRVLVEVGTDKAKKWQVITPTFKSNDAHVGVVVGHVLSFAAIMVVGLAVMLN